MEHLQTLLHSRTGDPNLALNENKTPGEMLSGAETCGVTDNNFIATTIKSTVDHILSFLISNEASMVDTLPHFNININYVTLSTTHINRCITIF